MRRKEIATKARPGFIILDTSTGTPQAAIEVAQQLAGRKIYYLAAPVSGGTKGAVEGKLTFIVGGGQETFAKIMP
ncbi:MAG: NAD(P)-binding domain-containing protein [Thermodesulfobacteriota bacterium]